MRPCSDAHLQYNFPGMHADLDKIIQAVVSQDLSLVPGAPSFVLRYVRGGAENV
jgi:hypothetical protein